MSNEYIHKLRNSNGYYIDPAISQDWLSQLGQPTNGTVYKAVITARAAYTLGIADAVVCWAVERGHLAAHYESPAVTALSEGIANATVHGSLGVLGMDAYNDDPNGYFSAINDRLADFAYATLPIAIMLRVSLRRLWFHVEDTGRGAIDLRHPHPIKMPLLAGRGRKVMAAMAVRVRYTLNGRRTSMSFPHA